MLSNMFDPTTETAAGWDLEVKDDVIEEGNKHGGFLHIVVDKASPQGNVYVKCPNIATAVAAVNALHGRWFAGKVITAAYVPLVNYHNLFPDSVYSTQILTTRRWECTMSYQAFRCISSNAIQELYSTINHSLDFGRLYFLTSITNLYSFDI